MAKYYLNSYRPLIRNRFGRQACRKFGHPPFVDASCRREPDFESAFPSITAICRVKQFAPRLEVGDSVIYVTTKGSAATGLRHVVAALQVIARFDSHRAAAEWYKSMALPVPSNCLVPGNPPLDIDHTDGGKPPASDLRRWDLTYQLRTRRCGTFLVCKPLKIELHKPPTITEQELKSIFGKVPATRTPPAIKRAEFDELATWLAIRSRHR